MKFTQIVGLVGTATAVGFTVYTVLTDEKLQKSLVKSYDQIVGFATVLAQRAREKAMDEQISYEQSQVDNDQWIQEQWDAIGR